MMRNLTIVTLVLLSYIKCISSTTVIPGFYPNMTLWDNVLQTYVQQNETLAGIELNTIIYDHIGNDSDFHEFLDQLAQTDTSNLTYNEFYALYINAYNALAIDMIVKNPCIKDLFGKCKPIKSIVDIGTWIPWKPVWNMNAGTIGGKKWSLDDVENHLRSPPNGWPEDPRLHAAIVCASISCPNVRKQAYTPDNLNQSLYDNFNDFMNNTKKGMEVHTSSKKLTVSPIFDWFSGDFKPSVIQFIIDNLDPSYEYYDYLVENQDDLELEYFGYNWNVNSEGSDVPCYVTCRPCYQLWAFLLTMLFAVILASIIAVIYHCSCKKKKKGLEGYTAIPTN